MSDPVDRLALDMATDLLKEHGFDQLADVLRKACRPTVPDVLPLAIEYRKAYPHHAGFFAGTHVSDSEIVESLALERRCGSEAGQSLLSLLLEMSVSQRRKVARRARDAVERERQEERMRADPASFAGSILRAGAVQWGDANTTAPLAGIMALQDQHRQYGDFRFRPPVPAADLQALADEQVRRFAAIDFAAHFRSHPSPRFEVDGETFEAIEAGDGGNFGTLDGRYVIGRSANGVHRRFSGLRLLDVRFVTP